MLIQQLHLHERILIGPDVILTCVRTKAGSLVLGIEAPPEWLIRRVDLEESSGAQHAASQMRPGVTEPVPGVPHDHIRIEGCYRCVWLETPPEPSTGPEQVA